MCVVSKKALFRSAAGLAGLLIVMPWVCMVDAATDYECQAIEMIYVENMAEDDRWKSTIKEVKEKYITNFNRTSSQEEKARILYCLGELHSFTSDYGTAVEFYTKSIELDPSNPLLYFSRALARESKNDYSGAINDIDKAVSLEQTLTLVYMERARINYKLARYEEALEDVERELRRSGNERSIVLNTMKGEILTALGNYEEAVRQYQNVLDFLEELNPCGGDDNKCYFPRRTELVNKLINTYCLDGRPADAQKVYKGTRHYLPKPEDPEETGCSSKKGDSKKVMIKKVTDLLSGPIAGGFLEHKQSSGPRPLDSNWTMISAFLHYEQQALEKSNEKKKTYPFT